MSAPSDFDRCAGLADRDSPPSGQTSDTGSAAILASAPAATAARAIAGALVRHALTAAGTALVARGIVDQGTADNAVGPIGDYVVGSAIALGAAGWGVLRARAAHWKWVQAWTAPARPLPPA